MSLKKVSRSSRRLFFPFRRDTLPHPRYCASYATAVRAITCLPPLTRLAAQTPPPTIESLNKTESRFANAGRRVEVDAHAVAICGEDQCGEIRLCVARQLIYEF